MTGAAVTALQQKLVAARFLSSNDFKSGPGVYGPRTEAAVKRLQAHAGLPVTGVAGPSTQAALQSGVRFEPPRPPPAASLDTETTSPTLRRSDVFARLSETLSDEVTTPMGHRVA